MKREKMIDILLCYMRNEIITTGGNVNTTHFDFLFDSNSKGNNDLINLQKKLKIDDESVKSILRECVTDGYIKRFSESEEYKYLRITDKGMARAKSVQMASPKKQFICSVLSHPLFNTVISATLSFIIGYYLGGKQ